MMSYLAGCADADDEVLNQHRCAEDTNDNADAAKVVPNLGEKLLHDSKIVWQRTQRIADG